MTPLSYHEAKKVLEQQKIAEEVMNRYERLRGLHAEHGFQRRRELIQVLEDLENEGRGKGAGRTRRLSRETIEQIRNLKEEGKSNAAISRQTGTSPVTVAKYVGESREASHGRMKKAS